MIFFLEWEDKYFQGTRNNLQGTSHNLFVNGEWSVVNIDLTLIDHSS